MVILEGCRADEIWLMLQILVNIVRSSHSSHYLLESRWRIGVDRLDHPLYIYDHILRYLLSFFDSFCLC